MADRGLVAQIYDCGDGDTEYHYANAKAADRDAFLTALSENGFTQVAENTIGTSKFNTYQRGRIAWQVCYYPEKSMLKCIYADSMVMGSALRGTTVTPSIAQLELEWASAPGMCYVIQLSDGRFIIIDGGGQAEGSGDHARLYNYLVNNKPASDEKPIIAGWLFTHAHMDHMNLAHRFIKTYKDRIVLEATYANLPDFKSISVGSADELSQMKFCADSWETNTKAYFPDAKNYKFHTGQKFTVGDAEFEILYTHEDYFPTAFGNGNHTSSAFRVRLGGHTAVFLGDTDEENTAFISSVYGSAIGQCDVLQVTHHGLNGGNKSLYENLNPQICLWSIEDDRFNGDECSGTGLNSFNRTYNKWLRSTSQASHYTHSKTTVISMKDLTVTREGTE